MAQTSGQRSGRRPSLLIGTVASLLVFGVTLALVKLDVDNEVRRAGEQLDLMAQGGIESMHSHLRDIEILLLSSHRDEAADVESAIDRLEPIAALASVKAVGFALSDGDPIAWSNVLGQRVVGVDAQLVSQADSGPDLQILHYPAGSDLLLARPTTSPSGERTWDLALINMHLLSVDVVPDVIAAGVIWDFEVVPPGTNLERPDRNVHREYLILEEGVAWQLELEWSAEGAAGLGVGTDWEGVAVGLALALLTGALAARWIQRRYMEADIRATHELLDQKDMLLLAISHQLRTPLTGAVGFLRLASEEPTMSESQRLEFTEIALEQAEHASEIVEDLLVAARLQDEQLMIASRPLDLVSTLERAFAQSHTDLEKLEIELEVGEDALALADPLRTRQVFRNLFNNGRDANVSEWLVTIKREDDFQVVRMDADAPIDEKLTTLSRDTVGLPVSLGAIRSRVEIVERLCEAMGGRLEISDRESRTSIVVRLPAAADKQAEAAATEPGKPN